MWSHCVFSPLGNKIPSRTQQDQLLLMLLFLRSHKTMLSSLREKKKVKGLAGVQLNRCSGKRTLLSNSLASFTSQPDSQTQLLCFRVFLFSCADNETGYKSTTHNGPCAAGQSRGNKKPPCLAAIKALRQNKEKNYHFKWCKRFDCLSQCVLAAQF